MLGNLNSIGNNVNELEAIEAVSKLLGPKKAYTWFVTENVNFNNSTPMQLIINGKEEVVFSFIKAWMNQKDNAKMSG